MIHLYIFARSFRFLSLLSSQWCDNNRPNESRTSGILGVNEHRDVEEIRQSIRQGRIEIKQLEIRERDSLRISHQCIATRMHGPEALDTRIHSRTFRSHSLIFWSNFFWKQSFYVKCPCSEKGVIISRRSICLLKFIPFQSYARPSQLYHSVVHSCRCGLNSSSFFSIITTLHHCWVPMEIRTLPCTWQLRWGESLWGGSADQGNSNCQPCYSSYLEHRSGVTEKRRQATAHSDDHAECNLVIYSTCGTTVSKGLDFHSISGAGIISSEQMSIRVSWMSCIRPVNARSANRAEQIWLVRFHFRTD
jgi:hypothetical protein